MKTNLEKLSRVSLFGKSLPKRKLYCVMVYSSDSCFFFSMLIKAYSLYQADSLFRRFIKKHSINFIGECTVEVKEV